MAQMLFNDLPKPSPEKVLEKVKAAIKEQGPINGSWIHMKTEPFERDRVHYTVYRGGISKSVSGASEQYEFIADATTGTILSIQKI